VAELLADRSSSPQERLAAFCIDANVNGVSWQQTIRGIRHHVRWDAAPAVVPQVRVLLSSATGGQKPFSIAAAIVTLRSPDQRFQYVTNQGEG